jgi:hypothetical protein
MSILEEKECSEVGRNSSHDLNLNRLGFGCLRSLFKQLINLFPPLHFYIIRFKISNFFLYHFSLVVDRFDIGINLYNQ